ncbi:hypothetical protein VP01_1990g1 [Puccinia sorghi]|uniref:Uncharacterized protein n=1 Tax=Puccinia sorghi TaxID=27349 RepID=A0A0L6VDF6_9BASI|nr:hypothetical protein VP01_1990g1 [Puccinia sorghi]
MGNLQQRLWRVEGNLLDISGTDCIIEYVSGFREACLLSRKKIMTNEAKALLHNWVDTSAQQSERSALKRVGVSTTYHLPIPGQFHSRTFGAITPFIWPSVRIVSPKYSQRPATKRGCASSRGDCALSDLPASKHDRPTSAPFESQDSRARHAMGGAFMQINLEPFPVVQNMHPPTKAFAYIARTCGQLANVKFANHSSCSAGKMKGGVPTTCLQGTSSVPSASCPSGLGKAKIGKSSEASFPLSPSCFLAPGFESLTSSTFPSEDLKLRVSSLDFLKGWQWPYLFVDSLSTNQIAWVFTTPRRVAPPKMPRGGPTAREKKTPLTRALPRHGVVRTRLQSRWFTCQRPFSCKILGVKGLKDVSLHSLFIIFTLLISMSPRNSRRNHFHSTIPLHLEVKSAHHTIKINLLDMSSNHFQQHCCNGQD